MVRAKLISAMARQESGYRTTAQQVLAMRGGGSGVTPGASGSTSNVVDALGHTAPIAVSHEHWAKLPKVADSGVSPEVTKALTRAAQAMNRVATAKPVHVSINNSTSARVAVSVNAAVN